MQETKLSVICERVFDRCLAPMAGGEGCDNMTMILVQFKKPFNSGASTADQPQSHDKPESRNPQSGSQKGAQPRDQPESHNQKHESEKGSAAKTIK